MYYVLIQYRDGLQEFISFGNSLANAKAFAEKKRRLQGVNYVAIAKELEWGKRIARGFEQ